MADGGAPAIDWTCEDGQAQWVVTVTDRLHRKVVKWRGPAANLRQAQVRAVSDAKRLRASLALMSGGAPLGRLRTHGEQRLKDSGRGSPFMEPGPGMTAVIEQKGPREGAPSKNEIEAVAEDVMLSVLAHAKVSADVSTSICFGLDKLHNGSDDRIGYDAGHSAGCPTMDIFPEDPVIIPNAMMSALVVVAGAYSVVHDKVGVASSIGSPSATLQAARRAILLKEAPQRAKRVAAFLHKAGLRKDARAFLDAYGRAS